MPRFLQQTANEFMPGGWLSTSLYHWSSISLCGKIESPKALLPPNVTEHPYGDRLNERLQRNFFAHPTLKVARDLIGCRLVRILEGQRISGLINETEAYIGETDQASHAAIGKTQRNAVMYGPPGYAYVYLIYGVHHCLNIVTEREGFPAAVLIRSLIPQEGLAIMRRHRGGRPDSELTNGPGKLCQALAIDLSFNGEDLVTSRSLFVERGVAVASEDIMVTPRIGVGGDDAAKNAPWRFWWPGESENIL